MPFDVQAALVALRFDSEDPIWPNRDRFVLFNGHASMLLYAIHHLSGVRRPLQRSGQHRRCIGASWSKRGLTIEQPACGAARDSVGRPLAR